MEMAFADDLLLITKSVEGSQYILKQIELFLNWTQTMSINPNKSTFIAFKKRGSKKEYYKVNNSVLRVSKVEIYPLQND